MVRAGRAQSCFGELHAVPRHEVGLEVRPTIWLSKVDIEIPVRSNGEYIGRLHVSQGSVDWIPAHKLYGRRLGWEKFGELMSTNGRRIRARPGRRAP
jgi:hypothetical protein